MGAYGFEYDLAISAGVKSEFDASPIEIENGEVSEFDLSVQMVMNSH